MAQIPNLMDLFSRVLTPETTTSYAGALNVPESALSKGFAALAPTLLAAMAGKAATTDGAASLFNLVTSSNVDENIGANLPWQMTRKGGADSFLAQGASLLSSLFSGAKQDDLMASLGGLAGVSGAQSRSLLLGLAPLLIGTLKRFVLGRGIDAPGLAALLRGQGQYVGNRVDNGLLGALGLGGASSLLSTLGWGGAAAAAAAPVVAAAAPVQPARPPVAPVAPVTPAVHTTTHAAAPVAASGGIGRFLPWIIGAAALAFLLSMCNSKKVETPAPAPAPAVVAPAPVPATPASEVAPAAVAPAPVAEAMPQNVYFNTGSADVDAEGQASVAKAVEWLKGDAGRKVALTGYTDKRGSADANAELAKNRAKAVRAAIVAGGITEDRIEMQPPLFVEANAGASDAAAADRASRRVEINPK